MPIDEKITVFIRTTFRSVWALELLCFLRKNPDRSFSHAEMIAGLRGSDLVVSQSRESLVAAGLALVEADGSARYTPATRALDESVIRVEELYRLSPDAVRRMIISAANPGITAFSDAFRLRKD